MLKLKRESKISKGLLADEEENMNVKEINMSMCYLPCVLDGMEKLYGVEENCDLCEFNMSADAGGTFGGQIGNRGTFRYCELGYWKEET